MYSPSILFRLSKISFFLLLFFLGIVSNVSANIRIDHCTDDCGSWLVGSVYLQPSSVQWAGSQVASSITLDSASSFGFSGPSTYLLEPTADSQWGMAQSGVMVMRNAQPGGRSPSMGHFFAPDKEGEVYSKNYYEAILTPPINPVNLDVRGYGVADNDSNPAITLQVKSNIPPVSCPKGEQCISLDSQGRVTFTITPQVREPFAGESNSAEIQKAGLIMVELHIQEESTVCSRNTTPAFKEGGFVRVGSTTLNEFNDVTKYFHYLQALGPNNPPNGKGDCTREYSFLTSKENSFQVQAINQRETGTGFVNYTFFIRGHYDDKNLVKWPGSHRTFHLTTIPLAQEPAKELPEIKVLDGNSEIANGVTLNVTTGKEITIQNTGTAQLTLSNPVISENFQIVGEFPTTIDAGSSNSFKIRLSTTTVGKYNGEIKFNSNDTDESSMTFKLEGEVIGQSPEMTILDGNNEIVHGATLDITMGKEIMIQNHGTAQLTLSNLVLSGNFRIEDEFPTTINAGGSKSFKIKLLATTVGKYLGEIKFNSNDVDESSITFKLEGEIIEKVWSSSQVFEDYRGCLSYCNSCTDEACHNNCKDDACGQSLLATVQLSDMDMDDFCQKNPTTEACIVKKVCSGKPEACGTTGGDTTPEIAQCKEVCKTDPFECVGIEGEEFVSQAIGCNKFGTDLTNANYLQIEDGEKIVGTLYLPTVDIFFGDLLNKVEPPARRVCIAASVSAKDKDDLKRTIFQVINSER